MCCWSLSHRTSIGHIYKYCSHKHPYEHTLHTHNTTPHNANRNVRKHHKHTHTEADYNLACVYMIGRGCSVRRWQEAIKRGDSEPAGLVNRQIPRSELSCSVRVELTTSKNKTQFTHSSHCRTLLLIQSRCYLSQSRFRSLTSLSVKRKRKVVSFTEIYKRISLSCSSSLIYQTKHIQPNRNWLISRQRLVAYFFLKIWIQNECVKCLIREFVQMIA